MTNQSQQPDDTPHRPADDREEVYFHGSPLLRGELGRLALMSTLALLLFALAVFGWIMDWWSWIIILIALPIAVLFVVVPWLLTKTVRYRISNYRIDYERGLISKRIDTLELWHVDDISFYQSGLDRLLGVGTITVISHDDTSPVLALKGLPNPRPLFDSLKQRVIAVKRQRGVIKMDVG